LITNKDVKTPVTEFSTNQKFWGCTSTPTPFTTDVSATTEISSNAKLNGRVRSRAWPAQSVDREIRMTDLKQTSQEEEVIAGDSLNNNEYLYWRINPRDWASQINWKYFSVSKLFSFKSQQLVYENWTDNPHFVCPGITYW